MDSGRRCPRGACVFCDLVRRNAVRGVVGIEGDVASGTESDDVNQQTQPQGIRKRRTEGDVLRQALAMVLASAALLLTGCPRYPLNEAFWRYYVTKLDVAQIGQRADSRDPFTIRVGEKDFAIQVKPNPVWEPGCTEIRVDQKPSQRPCDPGVQTYSGRVLYQSR